MVELGKGGEGLANHVRGAHRNGRLGDHQLLALRQPSDRLGDRQDVAQIGASILLFGGTDGDEDDIGGGQALGQVGGKMKPVLGPVAPDQTL